MSSSLLQYARTLFGEDVKYVPPLQEQLARLALAVVEQEKKIATLDKIVSYIENLLCNTYEGDDMPLTAKGKKIKSKMKKFYGEEKGEKVFYASANEGKIRGVEGKKKKTKKK